MRQSHQLGGWSHLGLLLIGYLDGENRGLGVLARRGPGKKGGPRKKNVKMLDGENILEVREDPADQRCMGSDARDAQRLCPVNPETGNWERLHSTSQHEFLPYLPRAAIISLLGREVEAEGT